MSIVCFCEVHAHVCTYPHDVNSRSGLASRMGGSFKVANERIRDHFHRNVEKLQPLPCSSASRLLMHLGVIARAQVLPTTTAFSTFVAGVLCLLKARAGEASPFDNTSYRSSDILRVEVCLPEQGKVRMIHRLYL